MKKILINFFVVLSFTAFSQEKAVWDFPVKPGMKEWATFTTGAQMVEACQIPLDVLNTVSTKELTTICLHYPLNLNYMAYNNIRTGVNFVIRQFNGWQELSRREDGVRELIKVYADLPVLSQTQKDENSIDYRILFRQLFLELLLADDIFLQRMNHDELEELRKIAVNKYVDKLQHIDVYHLSDIKNTMLLIAVIMDKQDKIEKIAEEQDVITAFIQNFNRVDADVLTEMSKLIKE